MTDAQQFEAFMRNYQNMVFSSMETPWRLGERWRSGGGATVGGEKVGLGVPGLHVEWLRNWFVHCVLKLRPLAPQVG